MKYSVLLTAVGLFVSLVVSETLRSNEAFSHLSEEGIRERRSAAAPAAQPPVEHINYRPYSQVPSNIKQLLQFQQAREPITHIAAQPPPELSKLPSPSRAQYNPQIQYGGQSQIKANPQYQPQPQPQQAYQPQPQQAYQPQPQQAAYQPQPQQAYQPQPQQPYQHQPQQAYQRPQQTQAIFNPHGNQQQIPGNVFRPEQRRLY